jgi:hypothetical protein
MIMITKTKKKRHLMSEKKIALLTMKEKKKIITKK